MARMIPSYLSKEVKSSGEKEIFELFNNSNNTEGWIVLHSLNLPQMIDSPHKEIDFVVLAPGLGIFCLEVKAGGISVEDGIWSTTDRYGREYKLAKSPFQQAEDGMHSLLNIVKNRFSIREKESNLLFSYGVMFPYIDFSFEGIEAERWRVFDERYNGKIDEYIKNLSKNSCKLYQKCIWFNKSSSLPTEADVKNLKYLFRPNFEKCIIPKKQLRNAITKISKFTEEQYSCLDNIGLNKRILFQGAAGTGKTIIAVEAAKRSFCKSNKTLFICFNKLLGEWLRYQLKDYYYKDIGWIGTFHSYLRSIVDNDRGLKDRYGETDKYYKEILPNEAKKKIRDGYIEKFDRLIIDEGQDLIKEDYLEILDLLLKGGLRVGKWNIFCDFEKQNIFTEDCTKEKMLNILESRANFFNYQLNTNCRSTKPVAEEISNIFHVNYTRTLPENINGIQVDYESYGNEKTENEVLEDVLRNLKEQKIEPKDITILSSHRADTSKSIIKDFINLPIYRKEYNIIDFTDNHPLYLNRNSITFGTIYKFKGMENSYIILIDLAKDLNRYRHFNNKDQLLKRFDNLLYVGMTRARFGLIVIADKAMLDELKRLKSK